MIFHPEFYNHLNDQSNVRKIKMFLDKQLSKPGLIIKEGAMAPRNRHVHRAQSWLTLPDPMDCSPPGSSVHAILQARILQWVVIPFSRGSSQPRNQTYVSRIGRGVLYC